MIIDINSELEIVTDVFFEDAFSLSFGYLGTLC